MKFGFRVHIIGSLYMFFNRPWNNPGTMVFGESEVRDWDIRNLFGIATIRWPHVFIGVMVFKETKKNYVLESVDTDETDE